MSNFQLFKKYASHFSEEIKQSGEHLDEVVVAGEIKAIIFPTSEDQNDLSSHYIVQLDDGVGEIFVYVSRMMFNHYSFIEFGKLVALSGYVNILRREVEGKLTKECSLMAYSAEEITKEECNA